MCPDPQSPSSTADGSPSPGALFVLISFEGPDLWSQAGGLGVRVTGLADTLAELGHEVHVFFIGDPDRVGEERRGNLVLHRWSQWLSRHHSAGVYDGEEPKRQDLTDSLPSYVTERVLLPAIRENRVPIVLLEEWQTTDCAIRIADLLAARGVRERAVLVWNANNAYSFDRVDWWRLASSTLITTVSRYMRSIIRARGIDALVIPNGIPLRLVRPVQRARVNQVRTAFGGQPFFFKMARWGSDKGWTQALQAVRLLRERNSRMVLVARSGGPSGGDASIEGAASALGLRTVFADAPDELPRAALEARRRDADVVSLRFGVTEDLARGMYAAADGTLANSVSEPFGLVGLEAMAAGAVVYTGGTGEDYAVSGRNAVVLETLHPAEISERAAELATAPAEATRIRRAARESARRFTWEHAVWQLLRRVEEQAQRQGVPLAIAPSRSVPGQRGGWEHARRAESAAAQGV